MTGVSGRPSRTLVDEIKAKTYMWLAAWIGGIEPRGKNFRKLMKRHSSHHGAGHQNSKLDKWLRGYSTPVAQERSQLASLVGDKDGHLERLFNNPLWLSLKPEPLSDSDLIEIYRSQYFGIQNRLFRDCIHPGCLQNRKQIAEHTVHELVKIGDLMALSCLITLVRDRHIELDGQLKSTIIEAIFELTAINILMGPLSRTQDEMLKVITDVIKIIAPLCAASAPHTLNHYLAIHCRQLYMAEYIGLGYSIDAYSKAAYWATRNPYGDLWEQLHSFTQHPISYEDQYCSFKRLVSLFRSLTRKRHRYNVY